MILTTAHISYAIHGYKYDAIDYLLKPIDSENLIQVIRKALQVKEKNIEHTTTPELKGLLTRLQESKITVSDTKGIRILKTEKILFCKGERNYTTIVLVDNSKLVVSKNLKHLEEKLKTSNFLRTHKSYVINLDHVEFLSKQSGGAVIMSNGNTLPISKNVKELLYKKIYND